MITDIQRSDFLRALDASDLLVTDWESQFIASFLEADPRWPERTAVRTWFTPGRRKSIDKMIQKYRQDLELTLSGPSVTSSPSIPDADATGCQYLVHAEGHSARCNAPATHKLRNGFRYCQSHADQVTDQMKRHHKTIHLEKYEERIPFRQMAAIG